MKTLKFKTNINCSGCVAAVAPYLNGEKEILSWEVNTSDRDKILNVTTNNLSTAAIQKVVEMAGYTSQVL